MYEQEGSTTMILDHKHLIVRAEVNNPPSDVETAKAWIITLVHKIRMQLVTKLKENPIAFYSDVEGNRGITSVAIIETSHISLHAWDEENPAIIQLDVYSCADFIPQEVFDHFAVFDPVTIQYKFIDRNKGLKDVEL